MTTRCSVLVFVAVSLVGPSLAATTRLTGQVLLPDGAVAAGAKVTIRVTGQDGGLASEQTVVLDGSGSYDATVEVDDGGRPNYYDRQVLLIVDAPACALTFVAPSRSRLPLRLARDTGLSGEVLDEAGRPVAGASVMVVAAPGPFAVVRPNTPGLGPDLPQLLATSGADGRFAMRGLACSPDGVTGGGGYGLAQVGARAEVNGVPLAGCQPHFPLRPRATDDRMPATPWQVRLGPCFRPSGIVVNGSTGQPVAGATVTLRSLDPLAMLTPAVTSGPDGRFVFASAPLVDRVFAVGTHPDLAPGWTTIVPPRQQPRGAPTPRTDPRLELLPLATVRGRVLDPVTQAPALTPLRLTCSYCEPYNDGAIWVSVPSIGARVRPDGGFEVRLPVGPSRVYVNGPGYRSPPHTSLVVPAEGLPAAQLPLTRLEGYLFRLRAGDPALLASGWQMHQRDAQGRELGLQGQQTGEWFFWHPQPWVDTMEVRITVGREEKLPWTKFRYDQAAFPIEIALP